MSPRAAASEVLVIRSYSNPRVNAVIFEGGTLEDFTEQDWLDLAVAALDQAGLSARDQRAITKVAVEAFEYSGHTRTANAPGIEKCAGCDEQNACSSYDVTFTSGSRETVRYCDDCAALARINWNGETATIKAVESPQGAS